MPPAVRGGCDKNASSLRVCVFHERNIESERTVMDGRGNTADRSRHGLFVNESSPSFLDDVTKQKGRNSAKTDDLISLD